MKLWKTMPTSWRIWRMSEPSSVTLSPSMVMEPESNRSNRLMERSSVLLPEPEGPMISTTSPFCTLRSTPPRAWRLPKVFTAFFISMNVATMSQPFFHDRHEAGEKEGHNQIDQRDDSVTFKIPK